MTHAAGDDDTGNCEQASRDFLGLFLRQFVRASAAEHSVVVFIGHGMVLTFCSFSLPEYPGAKSNSPIHLLGEDGFYQRRPEYRCD
jgi:hypothetical protein